MYYTATKIPESYSSNSRKSSAGLQRVHAVSERDGKKLSPIDLSISNASTVQLLPLSWNNYHLTPSTMTVRNSGFTVMINATYDQETPYVTSGPLMGNYVFYQVHFHWGEHNETGSGHAVDGVRYPLEMHVVHLKRDCSSMNEAFKSKDGIAVMVHLFALREERNTHLDQLTAILQFIQKPKSCARLYPTPLSEIVHPFSSDYFLYWGGVGSPKGQYRILWLVSRNVLPVSAQQLKEFRELRDSEGKVLVTNSSKPHPLAGRSLLLVSPSDRTNETMYGISRCPTSSVMTIESDDSVNIHNAEYKSMADLEPVDINSCRICPLPKRVQHIANINVGYPFRINEGDTSVEESCIDLGNNIDSGVTVKTEMKYKQNPKGQKLVTNVNVTACRHRVRPKYTPSETVYSVVSARGSELHLRRKPLIVRQNDTSTEQACMLFSDHSSLHPTLSAPSLTTSGGFLTIKQEHTDLSNPPAKNLSSEIAVHHRDSEFGLIGERDKIRPYELYVNEVEKTFKESHKSSKRAKKVTIQEYDDVYVPFEQSPQIHNQLETRTGNLKTSVVPKQDSKINSELPSLGAKKYDKYYREEEKLDQMAHNKENVKYVVVKQIKDKNPFYKVIGELPNDITQPATLEMDQENMNNSTQKNNCFSNSSVMKEQAEKALDYGEQNKKLTTKTEDRSLQRGPLNDFIKTNLNKQFYREIHERESFLEEELQEHTHRQFHSKKNAPSYLPSISNVEDNKNKLEDNRTQPTEKPKKHVPITDHEREKDPHYQVSVMVRTTVSDHRQPGKKKTDSAQQYFVTKIIPVEKTSSIFSKGSNSDVHDECQGKKNKSNDLGHYYYARPINKEQQNYPEKDTSLTKSLPSPNNPVEQGLKSEYYEKSLEESSQKQYRKEKHISIRKNQEDERKICKAQVGSQELNLRKTETSPKHLTQDPNIKKQTVYKGKSYENEQNSFQQEVHHKEINKSGKQLQNFQLKESNSHKSNANLQDKDLIESSKLKSSGAIYKESLKEKSLLVNTNVYHTKNDRDEDITMVDKTITGKMGENQSTEGLAKNLHVEARSPNKTEVRKEINYNLVKSKHPEPQHYIKEPLDKSYPTAIIHQNLSLDQQIKGQSQIRQTVEYHDKTRSHSADTNKSEPRLPLIKHEQSGKNKFSSVSETYEESSHEEASTYQRFQQKTQYQPSLQTRVLGPTGRSEIQSLNKELENQGIQKEKSEILKLSAIDPRLMLPKAHTNSKSLHDLENHNKLITKEDLTKNEPTFIGQNRNEINDLQKRLKKTDSTDIPLNATVNNYEYEESTSENKIMESSTLEKTFKYGKRGISNNNPEYPLESREPLDKYVPPKHSPTQRLHSNLPSNTEKQIMEKGKSSLENSRGIDHEKDDDYEGVEIEEVFEENVVHTSQKTKEKKITARTQGETYYKIPRQDVIEGKQLNQAIIVRKVEIPEPNYVTRVPKQPLVEYEAYSVDPHQPFEIITETSKEVSSIVKTNKTFMMFKKINGKAVLNQPSIIEPMRMDLKTSKDKPLSPEPSFKTTLSNKVQPYISVPDTGKPPKLYNEEYELYESQTEKDEREVTKKNLIRAYNVVASDTNKYLKDENQEEINAIIKPPEDNKIQVKNSPQTHEQVSLKKVLSQPTVSNRPESMFTEYEYSETSLTSVKEFIQKEKKNYKYRINQQPGYGEEIVKPLTDDQKRALKSRDDFSGQEMSRDVKENLLVEEAKLTNKVHDPKSSIDKKELLSSAGRDTAATKNKIPEINSPPRRAGLGNPRTDQYIDEHYYESFTKSHKHESTKKHFIAVRARAVEEDPLHPGPSHQYVSHRFDPQVTSKIPKQSDTDDDEPTKDITVTRTGANEIGEGGRLITESMNESYDKNKQKSTTHSHQYALDKGLLKANGNVPITKTDGDIVIYIRQPRARNEQVSPKITVDVSDTYKMTPSELENQQVQVRELRAKQNHTNSKRKAIVPRKSKSAGYYHQLHSSETSDYEMGNNINSDSNEEQIIDTTHYNLTLKSKTEVQLPQNQSARVKSKAEVMIKPLSKPNTPTQPKTAQELKFNVDECCSSHRVPHHGYDSPSSRLDGKEEGLSAENNYSSLNQSPIKIDTKTSTVKKYPKLLFFNHWNAQGDALLENNGKTLRASLIESEVLPFLRGGPLPDDYIFYELHFHWGHKDCCGAEHIIDGKRNTLEAHFMYIKKGYESLGAAMNHTDGVAMVAVNLTVGGPPDPNLAELMRDMPLLREADTGAYVPAECLFSWIRPAIKSAGGYFSYRGSLTADASSVECVTWIIFPEPIIFCCQQSCEFRKLKSTKGELLQKNYRPPQPLNNRPVYYVPLTY